MQQKLLNIIEGPDLSEIVVDTRLSFKPFLNYIRKRLEDETSIKRNFFNYALEKFSAHPELEKEVSGEQIGEYKELLDLLYMTVSNTLDNEKEVLWGLSIPMTPQVFYGTDPFYQILTESNAQQQRMETGIGKQDFAREKFEHFYSFILHHFYNIRFRGHGEMYRNIKDPVTGLIRHFQVNIDTRFVEVVAKSPLPGIGLDTMRSYSLEEDALSIIQKLLPVEMFSLSGFSIITVKDVTADYAIQAIKDYIVNTQGDLAKTAFPLVLQSLKELVGSSDIEFTILPLLRVNGKLINDHDISGQSVLLSAGKQEGCSMSSCIHMMEKFVKDPKVVYLGDLDNEEHSQKDAVRFLYQSGISAYSLFPVYYNKNLVGAMEVYSRKKGVLNEKLFAIIEPAMNLIAQLIHSTLTQFDDQVEAVIKEKFTTLQPSVQWKFNEVAWHYLQNNRSRLSRQEPEEIYFNQVYPLYGAVDIRNSTIERNRATQDDLKLQFEILLNVLKQLKQQSGFGLLDEKIFMTREWSKKIEMGSGFNQEIRLNDFLENNITPFLIQYAESNAGAKKIIAEYFNAIDEKGGRAYENRRRLESSMTTVISSVNNYFDLLRDEIQQAYPCYFEKFRTDGVEYDIYIGQSITPDRPYSDIYLKNLRLLQLSSMAAIAKYSYSLLSQLSTPVETTQLIFIHSQPIDIRFRRDEKRFDVEGAYNIRYHIIKKRIDKVRLKDSKERLTQPHKIALVYLSQKEADEYVSYIRYLQGEKLLKNDLEYLELEELQGVSGLKALRVGVMLEENDETEISKLFQSILAQ